MRAIARVFPRVPLRFFVALRSSSRRFFSVESASAQVLFAASLVALVVAQLPAGDGLRFVLTEPLPRVGLSPQVLIGDGLMSLFFFVVGLELRREFLVGVLRDAKAAALPLFGALGGMAVPAAIYLVSARENAAKVGWGIGTATDIAFAAAGLALVSTRLPPPARTLLLAVAVLDDLGAIVVLGVGYGAQFDPVSFALAFAFAAAMAVLRPAKSITWVVFGVLAAAMWLALHRAGVHSALTGVVVAFLWPLARENAAHAAIAVTRVLDRVHGPVAFLVMPLFAFAHAGVRLIGEGDSATPLAWQVSFAVTAALVVGKPLGIVLGARAATLAGLASLPEGMRWSHVAVVGMLGGIGFTMALLVAGRAFDDPALLDAAKRGILLGSVLSAVVAAVVANGLPRYRVPVKDAAT